MKKLIKQPYKIHNFKSYKLANNHYKKLLIKQSNNETIKYLLKESNKDLEKIINKQKNTNFPLITLYNGKELYVYNNSDINTLIEEFKQNFDEEEFDNDTTRVMAIPNNFKEKMKIAYLYEVTMKKGKRRIRK